MNDHDDIRRLLSAYCSGDLDPSMAARVELHLASCGACRAELAELTTTLRLIRSTPEVEPPPWLTAQVMARLKAQQTEKRSWLQRIFFPLHIKLPMEVMALLMVCVTGWYITRSVETELRQPARQQTRDIQVQPAPAPIDATDAGGKQTSPTGPAPQTLPPPTLQSPAAKAAEQSVPQPVRDIPAAAPAYAPSPPDSKEERRATTADSGAEPMRAAPAAESYDRARNGLTDKKARSVGGAQSNEAESPAPAAVGRPAMKQAAQALPRMTVRLSPTDPSAAPAAVREALVRSGATVSDDSDLQRRRIKARIPLARVNELLERLERLGRITEHPAAPSGTAELEVTVQW